MNMIAKKHNKGIALFISLSLMLLLSLGAAVILLTVYNYANVSENQINRARAVMLAEAGIHYAYYKLRTDPTFRSTDDSDPYILRPDPDSYDVEIWIEPIVGRIPPMDAIKSKVIY